MKKFLVFLMILALTFAGASLTGFAVAAYVNVGPTTEFQGDVGTTGGYYISGTLLAVGDITDALNVTMTNVGATAINASLIPDSADDTDLGSATYEWANLYIGEAGKIYLRADQSVNLQATGAGVLTITAANGVVTSAGLTVTGALLPAAASSYALGSADAEFTDLFLDDSGYVYFGIGQDVNIQRTGAGTMTITATTITASADLTVTGTMGAATVTGEIRLITSDADPDTTGEIKHDSTVATMTGGALRWFDDDSSRMIVDLEADATDDDYVVTYDADADGFYMKEDATAAGNFFLHLMDVDAASADYVHANIVGTGAAQDISTEITNPDYGRNITVTSSAGSVGVVTITGTTADGATGATDAITIVDGATAAGVKAFVYVSNINVSDALIDPETVSIGIGDVIGLQNAISAEADIYMKTVDGVEEYGEISTKGNTTYNTLDCATIVQNEDITIYYHE